MNFSSAIGLILAIGVFFGAALTSTQKWQVFLDYHAALIVLGGTIAVTLISFSFSSLLGMLKLVFKRVLGNQIDPYEKVIHEIVDLAKGYRDNDMYLTNKSKEIKNHFLKEAVQLIVDGGLEPSELDHVLSKRANTHLHRYEEDAEMFKTLSKFPPAFGLLGAVLGIIAMMQSLGSAEAIKNVGPALAVALVATLYGIAVANFIFIPIGENLSKYNKVDNVLRKMVIEGIKLIRAKKHPLVVEEYLKSFVLPSERAKIKKAA